VVENGNGFGIRGRTSNRRGIPNRPAAAKEKAERTQPAKGSVIYEPGHRMVVPFDCSREVRPGVPGFRLQLKFDV
jgi:hypothetical protein